jgi:hypothetical protein
MSPTEVSLPPLDIKCSSTNCLLGLHYFGPSRRKKSPYPVGMCCDCGADLIDWDRTHKCAPGDSEYVFEMLRRECWRHEWWHRAFDAKAIRYADRHREFLESRARQILVRRVFQCDPRWDSRQTPKKGNPIYYAQHATATCCRKCISYWHGIGPEVIPTPGQVDYLVGLIMRYIDLRL